MTPDLTSQLIADCRALIQAMYPVLDVLQTELAGGVAHMALTGSTQVDRPLTGAACREDGGVPRRATSPAL
jgi:hypothetical protein